MFKSVVLSAVILMMSLSGSLAAYTSTFVILEKKDIVVMSDEQLTNTYIETLVEVEVRKDFFNRFGFVGKDLDDYKAVLKYRLLLLLEIHSRNLDIPQFDRY